MELSYGSVNCRDGAEQAGPSFNTGIAISPRREQLKPFAGIQAQRRNEPQNIEQGTAECRRKEEDTGEMGATKLR